VGNLFGLFFSSLYIITGLTLESSIYTVTTTSNIQLVGNIFGLFLSSLDVITDFTFECSRYIENWGEGISQWRPRIDSVTGIEVWVAPPITGPYIDPYVYGNELDF
jgi:hypothetical protein